MSISAVRVHMIYRGDNRGMNNHIQKIRYLINRFDIQLIGKQYLVESSGFWKLYMKPLGMMQDILKYEKEFQNIVYKDLTMSAKNGLLTITIPKEEADIYPLEKIRKSVSYQKYPGILKVALGESEDGGIVIGDIEKWINVLIAGVPGSGKSTLMNVFINCLIEQDPNDVKLVLIDIKEVELKPYRNIPHVLKLITEVDKVQKELVVLISEIKRRYNELERAGCRNIKRYREKGGKMPYIVVFIDELANVILENKSCEKQLSIIASKGRACGVHLVVATQRPSVDIITPLIKSNIDTRIAFHVASHYDSQVILDLTGAEKLRMGGDMLLRDYDGLQRIQSCYVTDEEIEENIRSVGINNYVEVEICDESPNILMLDLSKDTIEIDVADFIDDEEDEMEQLFKKAVEKVREAGYCNHWRLKKWLQIGDRKADELIEKLIKENIISKEQIGFNYMVN